MRTRLAALAVLAPLALGAAAPAQAAAPKIEQLVVFKSGKAIEKRVAAEPTKVKVGRRRCAVAGSTAMAALWRSKPPRIRLEDIAGTCGSRPRDSGQLYVRRIGRDAERGTGGWVYKVGRRAGSAGAADPAGAFGRGRLRRGQRVLWFYCRAAGDCQRTLELKSRVAGTSVTFAVSGYDDAGRGVRVAGATVKVAGQTLTTAADGTVTAPLPAGRYRAVASKKGLVRSFTETIRVG